MKIPPALTYAASALALCAFGAATSSAATEKVLYTFAKSSVPQGRLDQDSSGTLYGTGAVLHGNRGGEGGVYRLKQENGLWLEDNIFYFNYTNGSQPYAGALVDHATGILYGTTRAGGDSGYGTVYSLAPVGNGWSENVLHSFSGSDGAYPWSALLKDKATGNLYGTTTYGGPNSCGTAFQLAQLNGSWTFSTIYNFQGGRDACNPFTQLKPGARAGTLIGASTSGNANGQIFQLKEKHGVWRDSIVYSFTGGTDGGDPIDLDASSDGTIYGVAEIGGQYGGGVVFKLTPALRKYTYSVIYNFGSGSDGIVPVGLNFDAATGTLYGTTWGGGGAANGGTVFRLTHSGGGWTETILHSFYGGTSDGARPYSRPIVDRTTGALYGTTDRGGVDDAGTVYMVQP